MKKLFFALVALSAFWLSCDGDNPFDVNIDVSNTDSVAKESFSFEVDVSNRSRFSLKGVNGEIVIRGDETATTVKIEGEKRVGSESMADANAYMAYLDVKVQEMSNEVAVETSQPSNSHGRSYVVDYLVTLPETFELRIDNVNGAINIDSIKSPVRVENVNGEVVLTNIAANTAAHLVNGQINSFVTLPLDGTLELTLVNGNINVDIPKETSADFSANVTNGRISISNIDLHDIVQTSRSLRGTCGEGRGEVSLTTVNGNIGIDGM